MAAVESHAAAVLLQDVSPTPPHQRLDHLRRAVLADMLGAPPEASAELRIYLWLVLLAVPPMPTDRYLDIVRQGPSPSYEKIRNDTFRTLATDPLFRRRVTENSLTRVLNAASWALHDANEARINGWQSPPAIGNRPPLSFAGSMAGSPDPHGGAAAEGDSELSAHSAAPTESQAPVGYVQGMNVLAAPFLYVSRSEVEAFAAYNRLITAHCPGYVRSGAMDGVHRGLVLVDRLLAVVDPELAAHLLDKNMPAKIYAFASALTLCACTPPLTEVLLLWDFLFAYGPHLNLLCIVAQLVLIRDQLLASPSPNQILRSLPPLRAKQITHLALSFLRLISDDLFDEVVNHAK